MQAGKSITVTHILTLAEVYQFQFGKVSREVLNLHICRYEDVRKLLTIVKAGDLKKKKIFSPYNHDGHNDT